MIFTQAGIHLFGEKFKEGLVQRVEADGALVYHTPQSHTKEKNTITTHTEQMAVIATAMGKENVYQEGSIRGIKSLGHLRMLPSKHCCNGLQHRSDF